MIDDADLLRRYAEERSEEAFAELVRRRIGLVYSVAWRHTRDAQRAEDVTQAVFTALARKAGELARRPVLVGWLYRSAQFAASDAVRVEVRRKAREQEAHTMNESEREAPEPDWPVLRPVLDEGLNDLEERDRDAVLLRFFDGRSFAEIGAKLNLTENAARMRVERALGKLHTSLARRGVKSTAAALGVALGGQAGVAAPEGLAASVTSAALAGVGLTGAAAVGGGVAIFMGTTKMTVAVVGAVVAIGVGTAWWGANRARDAGVALAAAAREQGELRAKVRDLERQLAVQSQRAMEADEDAALLLNAVQAAETARLDLEETGPITQAAVDFRYKRAQDLVRSRRPVEALKDFLWCFDRGMVDVPFFSGVRVTGLLALIAELGKTHPAASEALRVRRDAAERAMEVDGKDPRLALVFGAINHALMDSGRTLAALDRMPPGDQRRSVLGAFAFDLLAQRGSYTEAAKARPFTAMLTALEQGERRAARETPSVTADQSRIRDRNALIISTGRNIEVLAGAGESQYAVALITRLLAFDASAETREQLKQRLGKVGRADLLPAASGR